MNLSMYATWKPPPSPSNFVEGQHRASSPVAHAYSNGRQRTSKQRVFVATRVTLLCCVCALVAFPVNWFGRHDPWVDPSTRSNILATSSSMTAAAQRGRDDNYNEIRNQQDYSWCRYGPSGLQALVQLSMWNQSSLSEQAPRIPPTLIFTHHANFFRNKKPRLLYDNVQHTIQEYRRLFNHQLQLARSTTTTAPGANRTVFTPKVLFLSDDECRGLVYQAHTDLAQYFDAEPDATQRSKMCRIAALYIHGGYYFDVDLQVMEALDVDLSTTRFVAVANLPNPATQRVPLTISGVSYDATKHPKRPNTYKRKDGRGFVPSFLASAPGNPILRHAIEQILAIKVKHSTASTTNAVPLWKGGKGPGGKWGSANPASLDLSRILYKAVQVVSVRCGSLDVHLLQQSRVGDAEPSSWSSYAYGSTISAELTDRTNVDPCSNLIHERHDKNKVYFSAMAHHKRNCQKRGK